MAIIPAISRNRGMRKEKRMSIFRALDDLLVKSGLPYKHLTVPEPNLRIALGAITHENHEYLVIIIPEERTRE
jgi:hypothetical protein